MKMTHDAVGLLSPDGNDIVMTVHSRHPVGECPWCDHCRVQDITREFLRRLDESREYIGHLYMWSLGTSLTDTVTNRKLLVTWWRVFSKRVWHLDAWRPVFRITEKGRRGFLHIHCVCTRFVKHSIILDHWRSVTGEKSNVHVSGQTGQQDPRRLAKYLMKYLTKESSSYRWCGAFYGLGRDRGHALLGNGEKLIYGGILEVYGYETEGYPVSDPQKYL